MHTPDLWKIQYKAEYKAAVFLKCTLNIKAFAITEHNTITGVADKLARFYVCFPSTFALEVAQCEHTTCVYLLKSPRLSRIHPTCGKKWAMKQRCHAEQNFNYQPSPPFPACCVPDWSEITAEKREMHWKGRQGLSEGETVLLARGTIRVRKKDDINNVNSMWSHLKAMTKGKIVSYFFKEVLLYRKMKSTEKVMNKPLHVFILWAKPSTNWIRPLKADIDLNKLFLPLILNPHATPTLACSLTARGAPLPRLKPLPPPTPPPPYRATSTPLVSFPAC